MSAAKLDDRLQWMHRRLQDLERLCRAVSRPDVGVIDGPRRFWKLMREDKFSPNEIFLLNLLDGRAERESGSFVSKEKLTELQGRVNPPECRTPGKDKLAFYFRCKASGLPTPEILAVSGRELPPSAAIKRIELEQEWARYLETDAPAEFVLKPINGSHGLGVLLLQRSGHNFIAPDGATYNVPDLLQHMRALSHLAWQVQRRLRPHRCLVDMSGTDAMQTLRFITYANAADAPRILFAWLRINGGKTIFDNFNFGAAGNLVGAVDLSSGRLNYVVRSAEDGIGLETVRKHPVTGVDFSRIELPDFAGIVALMLRAAEALRPLGTLGWDVAVTDSGPSLIEANWTWDPLPMLESWAPIVEALRGDY